MSSCNERCSMLLETFMTLTEKQILLLFCWPCWWALNMPSDVLSAASVLEQFLSSILIPDPIRQSPSISLLWSHVFSLPGKAASSLGGVQVDPPLKIFLLFVAASFLVNKGEYITLLSWLLFIRWRLQPFHI